MRSSKAALLGLFSVALICTIAVSVTHSSNESPTGRRLLSMAPSSFRRLLQIITSGSFSMTVDDNGMISTSGSFTMSGPPVHQPEPAVEEPAGVPEQPSEEDFVEAPIKAPEKTCKSDHDCPATSWCMNDPTKTAPYTCHGGGSVIKHRVDKNHCVELYIPEADYSKFWNAVGNWKYAGYKSGKCPAPFNTIDSTTHDSDDHSVTIVKRGIAKKATFSGDDKCLPKYKLLCNVPFNGCHWVPGENPDCPWTDGCCKAAQAESPDETAMVTGGDLALTFQDCGDSSTHAKVKDITPKSVPLGSTTTVTGSGTLDEDISDGQFQMTMSTAVGTLLSCSGDASQAKECDIKVLGAKVGSLTLHPVTFPIKKGDISGVPKVDIQLPGSLPKFAQKTTTKLTVNTKAGDKVICVNIMTAPAVSTASWLASLCCQLPPGVVLFSLLSLLALGALLVRRRRARRALLLEGQYKMVTQGSEDQI